MPHSYKMCTRCIMDTTDPEIKFDESGVCNHCKAYDRVAMMIMSRGETKLQEKLNQIVNAIKVKGKGKRYDCIIGVSGGVDSTFTAYKVKELGLRPLVVHLDNGWDAELAVGNIEKVLKKLDIDLYTYVMDWEEFKDLQLAFLKAGTPDSEIPTDHAIMAILHRVAAQEGVQYIVLGGNFSTESMVPDSWSQGHGDWRYINSVHKRFGRVPLKSFPHYSLFDWLDYKFVKRQKIVNILNYMVYNKREAKEIIQRKLDWRDYGDKHHESIYTRFYQAYILPRRFNFDKRRAHLSSLICSGQITREAALEEMKKAPYQADKLKEDKQFVIKKLGLTDEEFDQLMTLPLKSFWDYPSYKRDSLLYKFITTSYYLLYRINVWRRGRVDGWRRHTSLSASQESAEGIQS